MKRFDMRITGYEVIIQPIDDEQSSLNITPFIQTPSKDVTIKLADDYLQRPFFQRPLVEIVFHADMVFGNLNILSKNDKQTAQGIVNSTRGTAILLGNGFGIEDHRNGYKCIDLSDYAYRTRTTIQTDMKIIQRDENGIIYKPGQQFFKVTAVFRPYKLTIVD